MILSIRFGWLMSCFSKVLCFEDSTILASECHSKTSLRQRSLLLFSCPCTVDSVALKSLLWYRVSLCWRREMDLFGVSQNQQGRSNMWEVDLLWLGQRSELHGASYKEEEEEEAYTELPVACKGVSSLESNSSFLEMEKPVHLAPRPIKRRVSQRQAKFLSIECYLVLGMSADLRC